MHTTEEWEQENSAENGVKITKALRLQSSFSINCLQDNGITPYGTSIFDIHQSIYK